MEKPNYYSIIPADVRYDDRLKANEKLLYSEITALANDKGSCFAGNKYFSDLYKVSKTSVSLWIKSLKEYGYISVKLTYKEGTKEVLKRDINILKTPSRKLDHPPQENLTTPLRKLDHPPQENLKDNIVIKAPSDIGVFNSNISDKDLFIGFAKECIKDTQWLDVSSMTSRTNHYTIKQNLKEFIPFLLSRDVKHDSVREFKIHFSNWIRKKDITKINEPIDDSLRFT